MHGCNVSVFRVSYDDDVGGDSWEGTRENYQPFFALFDVYCNCAKS